MTDTGYGCADQCLDTRGATIGQGVSRVTWTDYRTAQFSFTTTSTGRVLVYLGLIGNGKDAWCQIDNVDLVTKSAPID